MRSVNYQQEFKIEQFNHSINFKAYDIVKIERYEVGMESSNFVAECQHLGCYHGDDYKGICLLEQSGRLNSLRQYGFGIAYGSNQPEPRLNKCPECIRCDLLHFNEVYVDGFYIDVDDWDKRPYIATLQTGIRVPVTQGIYDAWKAGWETGWHTVGDTMIIMQNDI